MQNAARRSLRKMNRLAWLSAGFGIGVAASVLLAPQAGDKTRSRIRDNANRVSDLAKEGAEKLGNAAGAVLEEGKRIWSDQERDQNMSDLKNKAKEKIDDAADVTKKVADQIVNKSKDVAHSAGKE